jgi:predicted nucleic acid-binding protein
VILPDPLPQDIYLDTSIVASAMIAGVAHHTSCAAFCEPLVANDCRVYFSQLLRMEIAETIKNFAVRNQGAQLPEAVREQYRLDQWTKSFDVRWRWLLYGLSQLDALLGRFTQVIELPVRANLWEDSIEIMDRWQLGSNDALHVATARHHGLRYLATTDRGLQAVTNPMIWLIRDPPGIAGPARAGRPSRPS